MGRFANDNKPISCFAAALLALGCCTIAAEELELRQGTNLALAANAVDGSLVLALQGGLYLLRAGEERAETLLSGEDAWEPDVAPDGTRVVYQGYREGSWDIWELALDGGEPRQLSSGWYDDREPQYSPDGAAVVFSSDRGGNYDLWLLRRGDGEPLRLTDGDANEYAPAFAPDGGRIAYVEAGRGEWLLKSLPLNEGDSGESSLLYRSAVPPSGLQWTPDGGALSFRTLDRDPQGNALTALRMLDIASGEVELLSAPDADVFPFRAGWLDEDTMAYTADGEITLLRQGRAARKGEAEGQARPFVVTLQYEDDSYAPSRRDFDSAAARPALGISQPAVSPDGAGVAFAALGDLWLWNPGSGSLRQLTDDPAADQMASWAADGKSIVYVSDAGGRYRIWRYWLDSDSAEPLPVRGKELSFPRLSPDGRRIAYFTEVPGNPLLHVEGQLTVSELDGADTRQLLGPMPPQPLNWSADGSRILSTRLRTYSSRFREGIYVGVSVDVDSGEAETLVPVEHRNVVNASLAPRSRQLVYSQDGVLNLWQLDETLQGARAPRVLVDALADSPTISAGGEVVVYQAGDKLLRVDTASGAIEDITPPLQWAPAIPEATWVLRAGRLFDGLGENYRENVDILIRGNRIAALGDFEIPDGVPVVDYRDSVVVPGLIEAHAHIGDHNQSEAQGRAWLSYGITSVRDPGSNPYLANERREAWRGGTRSGPRLFLTGHNIDGNRVYYAVCEGVNTDAHLERALQRSKLLQVDFFKTYVRLPDRQQKRVVEFAHAMGVPVTSHELLPAALNGVDNIEHFTGTSRRGYATKISELGRSYADVVEVLAETGMGIVPTMVVPGVVLTFDEQDDIYSTPQFDAFYGPESKRNYQDFMGFFGPGSEGYVDAYGSLLSTLVERDALVGTGTDSPFTPFGTGLHAEFRLYQREGLAPWRILRAATRDSARILGVEADLGTLEVGKLADLVVVDGDPLADIAELDRVRMTVVGGRAYRLEELLDTP